MTNHLRTIKVSILIGILMIGFIPILANHGTAARTKAISFNSYLTINYTATALNTPLQIDVPISVPVTVQFSTDIPDIFKKIPFPLNNIILFGAPIGPEEQIHLEIINPPDWANIYFSTSDLLCQIPFKSDGPIPIQTNLIISPTIQAPATPQRIDIVATCNQIKRLNNFTYQISIPFTPIFIPTMEISSPNSIRTVGPHESVSFQIFVTNNGNKITRVTPQIVAGDPAWIPTINPPEFEIQPGQESTFTLSLITPYNFGWHNEYGRFEIKFYSTIYPPSENAPSENQTIFLVVNNHGFSTPGFEFIIFLAAICVILLIIRKRRKNN